MVPAEDGVCMNFGPVCQPSFVVCSVWNQPFWVVSCWVVVEDFRTSPFSDCFILKSDFDEEELAS